MLDSNEEPEAGHENVYILISEGSPEERESLREGRLHHTRPV